MKFEHLKILLYIMGGIGRSISSQELIGAVMIYYPSRTIDLPTRSCRRKPLLAWYSGYSLSKLSGNKTKKMGLKLPVGPLVSIVYLIPIVSGVVGLSGIYSSHGLNT
jgi:hypothetical protein